MTPIGGRAPAATGWLAGSVICAVVVLGVLLAVVRTQPAGVFWDDGVYLTTARALASGEGYRFAHLPGSPPAVHFPPAWPLLLAAMWRLVPDFPANLGAFSLLNILLGALGAGLACAYAVRRAGIPAAVAVPVTAIFALTLPVMVLASVLFAEPLFLVCVVATLFAADRAVEQGGARDAVIVGIAAGVAMLARSTAVALVPAIVGSLLIARRRRAAAYALASAAAVAGPWMLWAAANAGQLAAPLRGNYGQYVSWLAGAVAERGAPFVAAIARQNIVSIERSFAVVFFPVGVREFRPLLIALLCVVVALGSLALWTRARTLVLFAICYAALIVVWPYAPDRFAWAVWPLAGIFIAAGAIAAWNFVAARGAAPAHRVAAGVVGFVAVLAVAGDAFYSARGVSRGWVDVAQRRNSARLIPVVNWVNANTAPTDVIACDGEPFVHLQTGRRVVPVHVLSPDEYLAGTPVQLAADELRALITAGGASYAVLSGGSAALAAAPLLDEQSGSPWLTPVDTLFGGGVAFRVNRSP